MPDVAKKTESTLPAVHSAPTIGSTSPGSGVSPPPPTSTASTPRTKPRMSFKAASQATLSFLSARRRIEDGLRNWNKRRMSKRGSVEEGWWWEGSY